MTVVETNPGVCDPDNLDSRELLSTSDEYFERFGLQDRTLEELKVINKFIDDLIQDQIDNQEVLTKAGCRRLCFLASYIDDEISRQELAEERAE